MTENKELVTKMVWQVANGEVKSKKAAEICGISYTKFYKRLRSNEEAYKVFRKKVSRRKKPLVNHQYNYEYKRDSDFNYAERLKKVMDEYHGKCKIADKVAQARAMGVSYGRYMAMCAGLGRL